MKNLRFWIPTIVGVLVTPLLIGLVVVSAGAGHGSYFPMLAFYPVSLLLLLLQPHGLTDAFLQQLAEQVFIGLALSVAVIQFPLYGFITSYANLKNASVFWVICKGFVWLHIIISAINLPLIIVGMLL